jgi:hypothetical protein
LRVHLDLISSFAEKINSLTDIARGKNAEWFVHDHLS